MSEMSELAGVYELAGMTWASIDEMVFDGAWPSDVGCGDVAWAWSTDGRRFCRTRGVPYAVPMAAGVILDPRGAMPPAASHFSAAGLALVKSARYGVPVRVFQRLTDGGIRFVGMRPVHADDRGFGASVKM